MPEQDNNKERFLEGNTAETQDNLKIQVVRSRLSEIARIRKGLPASPIQLDAKSISQLPDVPIIEEQSSELADKVIAISIKTVAVDSPFGLRIRANRVKKLKNAA